MASKPQPFVPSMSDAAVKARTGRDWAAWFGVLDAAGAAKLEHRAIVKLLSEAYAVPSWWRQMVTVEYERARGLRAPHETSSGFAVAVSKTVPADLSTLYAAAGTASTRSKWFPKGAFAPSSQTKDKSLRGAWNGGARLDLGFYAKGPGKSQIAVQISKLAGKADVERERAAWKAALAKLQQIIEE